MKKFIIQNALFKSDSFYTKEEAISSLKDWLFVNSDWEFTSENEELDNHSSAIREELFEIEYKLSKFYEEFSSSDVENQFLIITNSIREKKLNELKKSIINFETSSFGSFKIIEIDEEEEENE